MNDFHKGDKPRPGDKVRATLPTVDGVLVVADGEGVQLRLDDGSIHHLPGADIQVLERVDDPAKNLIGTLRREEHDGELVHCQAIATRNGEATRWVVTHSSVPAMVGEVFDHDFVAEFPVVGSCPGTPAAEVEKQPAGDRPPVHVDNEAIVTGQYDSRKGRGPRYFQGHSGTRQWKINPDGTSFYRTTSDQEWALCHATIAVLSRSASVREVDSLDGEPS